MRVLIKTVVVNIALCVSTSIAWAACESELSAVSAVSSGRGEAHLIYDTVHKKAEFPRDASNQEFRFSWFTGLNSASGNASPGDHAIKFKTDLDSFLQKQVVEVEEGLKNGNAERALLPQKRYNVEYPRILAEIKFKLCIAKFYLGLKGVTPSTNQTSDALKNLQQQSNQPQSQPQTSGTNPLQSQTQESQQRARDAQVRADAAAQRAGKRSHDPAAEASNCLELDKSTGLFGGFKNTCEYKVAYVFCDFRPKKDSWAEFHNCEIKHGIGADSVGPGRTSAAHTKNTEMVYWFACRDPAWPVDAAFVLGKGIEARCRNMGGQ